MKKLNYIFKKVSKEIMRNELLLWGYSINGMPAFNMNMVSDKRHGHMRRVNGK